ncbi:MAG: hypothetical protein WCJ30_29600, partial [Deltaproteobacteria bacterium]
VALFPACVTPATEVLIALGTNAPLDQRSLSLTVTVRSGNADGGAVVVNRWRWRAGHPGPDAACHVGPDSVTGCITDAARDVPADAAARSDAVDAPPLDAGTDAAPPDALADVSPDVVVAPTAAPRDNWDLGSFALVSGSNFPSSGTVYVTFRALIEASGPTEIPVVFEQSYAVRFSPHQTTRRPIFLNAGCARAADGCVAAGPCTVSVLCAERGQTCGESSECVPVSVPRPIRPDGGTLPGACGDSVCEGAETCDSCPHDCPCPPRCGDGVCAGGETCASCPGDCPCGTCSLAEGAACSAGAGAPACCERSRRCDTIAALSGTHCCGTEGVACSVSSGCCGSLRCVSGVCQPPPTCSLVEAQACTPGAGAPGCCQSAWRCASHGSATVCCGDQGGGCSSSSGCCGSLTCQGGTCQPPPSCGLAEAAVCTVGAGAPGCCSGGRLCASYTAGGATHCCRDEGGACTSGSGCCGNLQCQSGVCQPPPQPCSLAEAASCTVGAAGPA